MTFLNQLSDLRLMVRSEDGQDENNNKNTNNSWS